MEKTLRFAVGLSCSAIVLALTVAGTAAAAQGAIKVSLRDERGVVINGKVTAKMGDTVRNCDSAAGSCTLKDLAPGKWTLTARTGGGSSGGPRTVTAEGDKTTSITLTVKAPAKKTVLLGTTSAAGRSQRRQAAAEPAVKDLGAGTVRRVTGTCRDDKGVLINGTITVYQGSTARGESKSAAGKYAIYDLAPGSYKLVFRTGGGKTRTRSVTIPEKGEVSVNFQF